MHVSSNRSKERGFTLVEVLVVTTILAVLLGFSANALSRAGQGAALGSSSRLTRAALQRAKQLARTDRALSSVLVDPGDAAAGRPGALTVRLARRAVTMSFEESDNGRTPMGDAISGTLLGAVIVPGGTVRQAAQLAAGARIRGPALTSAPSHDPSLGFSLEMDVLPTGPGALARFGSSSDEFAFSLSLEADLSLMAEVMFAPEGTIRRLRTPPSVVAADAWNRVGVAYDGVSLIVTSHGVVEGIMEETRGLMVPKDGALVIGGGVAALIDTVTYVTVSEGEPFNLERGVTFDLKAPLSIRFDGEGRLDRRTHGGTVMVALVQEERREEVTVDLAGVIR